MFALAKIWKGTKATGNWVWELFRRADVPRGADSIPVPDNRTAAEILASNKVLSSKISEKKLQQQLDSMDATAPPPQQAAGAAARTDAGAAARTDAAAARTADDAKPKPEPEPKLRRGERRNQKLRDDAETKSLKKALKTPALTKWKRRIVVGGGLYGTWHLAKSSVDWAKENPEEWEKMKKALSGFEHVPGAAEAAVKSAPEILSKAGANIVENVEDAVRGVKDYTRGASTTMGEPIPAKAPAKAPAKTAAKAPAAKTNGGSSNAPAAKSDFTKLPNGGVPREKPAPPNSKISVATAKTTYPVVTPKVAKKAPKKLTDAQKMSAIKEEYGKYSEEAGKEWFRQKGIKADYDWDFPGRKTHRKGGEITSDSYMLRKKPKTTSEVKKGSRQSRSWNY